ILHTVFLVLHSLPTRRSYDLFPDPSIHRRNTGYALDILAASKVYDSSKSQEFNLAKLLTGSEGTLAITTEVTLQLDELPPQKMADRKSTRLNSSHVSFSYAVF